MDKSKVLVHGFLLSLTVMNVGTKCRRRRRN